MKDTDEINIARSNDFKKNLYHHVDKSCGQKTCAREIFRGTGLFQTHLKNNDNTIISRSGDFGETLLFSFRKWYVTHIFAIGLATDTNQVWTNSHCVIIKW